MNVEHNPYETPNSAPEASRPIVESARRQLLPVAILLLVSSILHITGGLFYFAFVYMQAAAPDADPMTTHVSTVYCMFYGITMLYCLVLASGAFSMMRQSSYLWAMTVCVLALVPLFGPCYFLAIPVGIWGIFVLRRPAVRDSFARF